MLISPIPIYIYLSDDIFGPGSLPKLVRIYLVCGVRNNQLKNRPLETNLRKSDDKHSDFDSEPKRRKRIHRLSKPSVARDPIEKLGEDLMEHLGITGNRTFNGLLKTEKDDAGRRLKDILNVVSGGALVPLMSYTLDRDDVNKIANLKGLQKREFFLDQLGSVKKEEDDDEEEDIDERMAAAIADMQKGEDNMEVAAPAGAPPLCAVCGDSASTPHLSAGPATCPTCFNFFRIFRMEPRGRCRNAGKCPITKATRANCVPCRYEKCISVGVVHADVGDGKASLEMERYEMGKKGESGPETLPDSTTAECPDGQDEQQESDGDGENSAIISDED